MARGTALRTGVAFSPSIRPSSSLTPSVEWRAFSPAAPCIAARRGRSSSGKPRPVGGGGRNEKPTAGGAGQSVGQPVALSYLVLSALSARHEALATLRGPIQARHPKPCPSLSLPGRVYREKCAGSFARRFSPLAGSTRVCGVGDDARASSRTATLDLTPDRRRHDRSRFSPTASRPTLAALGDEPPSGRMRRIGGRRVGRITTVFLASRQISSR